ncbi:hypothetical protein F5B17DRAFT_431385 [Nemania serpens]|nr:hypothetical protein F5B17DRAFT_431385 [Nemania serpens]
MQPLISVNTHTHISLISIHATPSTLLAALVVFFVFFFTFIASAGCAPLQSLSSIRLPIFGRRTPPIVTPEPLATPPSTHANITFGPIFFESQLAIPILFPHQGPPQSGPSSFNFEPKSEVAFTFELRRKNSHDPEQRR